ncbi:MAG TPA: response regulator [Azospirillum sp.]
MIPPLKTPNTPSVTVIDASPTQSLLLRHKLEERGVAVTAADTLPDGLAVLAAGAPAAVLLNLTTTGADAADAVNRIRERCPDVPVLLVGGAPDLTHDGRRVHILAGGGADGAVREICRLVALPDARPSAEEVLHRARILVVDDSVTYREFLRLELEEVGCAVSVASGAQEGLDALAGAAFDCVVIDLVMPGIAGTELCEAFDRSRRREGRLFDILVHTSQDREDLLIACLNAGADEFVGKSHSVEVLKTRLATLLRRKFYVEDVVLPRAKLG